MFELSIALKYLIPRRRQLSVSIISIISVLVIALVVWLILVFFSVSNGLEKMWVEKLITLTAPVRVTPTPAYYHSYYYLVDSISEKSNFTSKSISEKRLSKISDPYQPDIDEEIPSDWMPAERHLNGSLKDLVKEVFASIDALNVPGLTAHQFEMTYGNLRLRLVRPLAGNMRDAGANQAFLTQGVYLGSFESQNPNLQKTLLPLASSDVKNLLETLSLSSEGIQEEASEELKRVSDKEFQNRLKVLFENISIMKLKTPASGWLLPRSLLPESGTFQVSIVMKGDEIERVMIPQEVAQLEKEYLELKRLGFNVKKGKLQFPGPLVTMDGVSKPLNNTKVPLIVPGGVTFEAKLIQDSLKSLRSQRDLQFDLSMVLQKTTMSGKTRLGQLEIDQVQAALNSDTKRSSPFWIHSVPGISNAWVLPRDKKMGEGVLLPRSFREAGILVGDQGFLSYFTPTTSSMQEQRIPIYVAGFFDHGVIPIGGKFVMINPEIASLIRSSYDQNDSSGTGINVRFSHLNQAEGIKAALVKDFQKKGIDRFWKVETYREYDFTKDLIQQLGSEKNLFTLISVVIIVVACSNIISMLIILVNDKKVEIGILRAMGATSRSIGAIFGLCGFIMGAIGSLLGIGFAIFTLRNLQALLDFIGRMQGHDVFSAVYYGNTLPNELSFEALGFVLVATACISLLAGIVPAVKASMLRPSAILRSE